MSATRKNGIKGSVDGGSGLIPIKSWEATFSVEVADASSSDDAGFARSTPGNKSCKGTVACLWDAALETTDQPTELEEGDVVTLKLYPSDGPDPDGTPGYFTMSALITEKPVSCKENNTVAWSFSFVNKGAYEWVPSEEGT
jgi:hypothetical protein